MHSNLDGQPPEVGTQTEMPESIRARIARFEKERAATGVTLPTDQQQYCTRGEMEVLRYEMRMQIDEAIKSVGPRYSAVDLIDFRCRPIDDEIAKLKDDLANVTRALGRYAISECGEVPKNHLLTYLKCQVWHSPWLTKDEQKIKSIWSLRLSVEVAHHRLPEEINIRLFPLRQFYKTATKPANGTDSVMTACDFLMDHGATDDAWAGFIQGFARKEGHTSRIKRRSSFTSGHSGKVQEAGRCAPASLVPSYCFFLRNLVSVIRWLYRMNSARCARFVHRGASHRHKKWMPEQVIALLLDYMPRAWGGVIAPLRPCCAHEPGQAMLIV